MALCNCNLQSYYAGCFVRFLCKLCSRSEQFYLRECGIRTAERWKCIVYHSFLIRTVNIHHLVISFQCLKLPQTIQHVLLPLRPHLLEPINSHDERSSPARQRSQIVQIPDHLLQRYTRHNLALAIRNS
jgi:hypothetical protein